MKNYANFFSFIKRGPSRGFFKVRKSRDIVFESLKEASLLYDPKMKFERIDRTMWKLNIEHNNFFQYSLKIFINMHEIIIDDLRTIFSFLDDACQNCVTGGGLVNLDVA